MWWMTWRAPVHHGPSTGTLSHVVDDVRALHIYPTASAIPLSLAKTLNPKP